jgi:hypothetical protein
VVLRSGLHRSLGEGLQTALLSIGEDSPMAPALADFGLQRFVPVTYEHYAAESEVLRSCERALGVRPQGPDPVRGGLPRDGPGDQVRIVATGLIEGARPKAHEEVSTAG